MAQNMVGIRGDAKTILRKLARRKRVSQQGLLSALVLMANGDVNLGIIDLDWDEIRRRYPNQKAIQKKSWDAVTTAVRALMEETDDPEEMAMRSRFTKAQCERAIREIKGE